MTDPIIFFTNDTQLHTLAQIHSQCLTFKCGKVKPPTHPNKTAFEMG